MPIQAYFFNHFIIFSALVSANNHIKENNNINHNSRKNVKPMKACYKKEKSANNGAPYSLTSKFAPLT